MYFNINIKPIMMHIIQLHFSVSPETTDIQEFEQEILVQGHPGTIYGLTASLEDQFVSSGT